MHREFVGSNSAYFTFFFVILRLFTSRSYLGTLRPGMKRGRCWVGCWPRRWGLESEETRVLLVAFGFSFIASICSNTSTTSFMEGRFLGSAFRHFKVSSAACTIALDEYWPSILESIMVVLSFFLCESNGFNHSTKFRWPVGRFQSSALWPDSISSSTTPKPYTSLFTYKWPVHQEVSH